MLDEKDEALAEIEVLAQQWNESNPGFDPVFHSEVGQLFDVYVKYVRLFRLVGHSYVLAKYMQKSGKKVCGDGSGSIVDREKVLVNEMKTLEKELEVLPGTLPLRFRYPTLAMMNCDRLRAYREDVQEYLKTIEGSEK